MTREERLKLEREAFAERIDEVIKFRTQHTPHLRLPRDIGGPSLTIQSAAAENDLNLIVSRMVKGLDPGVPIREARYGMSVTPEQREASMQTVADAKNQFEELSPEERGTTKSFAEYLRNKLTREGGPLDPLDVNGPTDSKSVSSTKKKGATSEKKTANKQGSEKNIPEGHGNEPEE